MFDLTETYSFSSEHMSAVPITRPNIKTGEGRTKCRPLSRHKVGDQKKKAHRKMAKKSRRASRR
jgi:hypothetical protein